MEQGSAGAGAAGGHPVRHRRHPLRLGSLPLPRLPRAAAGGARFCFCVARLSSLAGGASAATLCCDPKCPGLIRPGLSTESPCRLVSTMESPSPRSSTAPTSAGGTTTPSPALCSRSSTTPRAWSSWIARKPCSESNQHYPTFILHTVA